MSTPNAAHCPANNTRLVVRERPRWRRVLPVALLTVAAAISIASGATRFAIPAFTDVTVHDPSVVRSGANFYVFGSHLASARTSDGLRWTQITTDTDASQGNLLVPDPQTEFREALDWVGSNTFWAPDVIQLARRPLLFLLLRRQAGCPARRARHRGVGFDHRTLHEPRA